MTFPEEEILTYKPLVYPELSPFCFLLFIGQFLNLLEDNQVLNGLDSRCYNFTNFPYLRR